jgi:hypothetical protein
VPTSPLDELEIVRTLEAETNVTKLGAVLIVRMISSEVQADASSVNSAIVIERAAEET